MDIDTLRLEAVDLKLKQENALLATVCSAIWLVPLLVLWYAVYHYKADLGPLFMVVSGFLIGLSVRFHGKGYKGFFSFIAFINYNFVILAAISLEIIVGKTIGAIFLFGLYAIGAGIAIHFARRQISIEENRAYLKLTADEKAYNKLRNKWFLVLPVQVVALVLSVSISIFLLSFFTEYQTLNNAIIAQQDERQRMENKEIDISIPSLDKMTTQDVLFYAHAYFSGHLAAKNGKYSESFPRSKFKAETLLKYLVKERNDARAKFLLGYLYDGENSIRLLQESAEQGDGYGKIYDLVSYGCLSNINAATDLLVKMRDITSDQHLEAEITSVLYVGLKNICNDEEPETFTLNYILGYVGNTAD